MKYFRWYTGLLFFLFLLIACEQKTQKPKEVEPEVKTEKLVAPAFNSDSAYYFIEKQVSFGPRVPGTVAHKACKEWLVKMLKAYTPNVMVQEAQVTVYNGKKVPMYNIIASFNPENPKRVLLAAHWDTRPFADQDKERIMEPIAGANDGGSGVGVLLEIARQLSATETDKGIDIILFDVEDYGEPDFEEYNKRDTYCLGSQYWAKNPHVKGYKAEYGILLDMVGAKNAVFTLEGTSMRYAPMLMRSIWDAAIKLGHTRYFSFQRTDPILDDHYYVNEIAGIPMIDIIHHERTTIHNFPGHWHTHADNMEVIDKNTLQAVGETVLYYVKNN